MPDQIGNDGKGAGHDERLPVEPAMTTMTGWVSTPFFCLYGGFFVSLRTY